jgi:homocysteine S-methyltransferase
MDILSYLSQGPLLFDGAMGTYFAKKTKSDLRSELQNLAQPEVIAAIHQEYLDAGCTAIKTNTFGLSPTALGQEECRKHLAAAYTIAENAAGKAAGDAFVFADIGPAQGADPAAEYCFLADCFLALGAKHFLFETLSQDTGIPEVAAHIKEQDPSAFILVSFAAQPDGFTRTGQLAAALLRELSQDPHIDAVGLNCVSGAKHMVELTAQLGPLEKPLSVMPNAGYPTVLGSRTFYHGDPEYFALQSAELRANGASILGGCCGTTPAHMSAAAEALKAPAPKRTLSVPEKPVVQAQKENPFWTALQDPNRKPVAVELDPPEAADVTKFMAGAKELKENGADIITIADCPIARARMDSSLLACKIRRELDMQALPHMTCRDRNLNATKALLLGLAAEDVHNVLVITGDPIPTASRDEVKSVYNFNSRLLARYVNTLNETVLPTPFQVFGALNLNAVNFGVQLRLAKEKVENGVCGFLTQPVLTQKALDNLKLAHQELDAKILGGIIPIVSQRNANFMNSEVSGITVDEQIIRLYEGLDRAAGEDLAVKISTAVAKEMADYVDGFYLITPFGRTGLMARIMNAMGQAGIL